ncbi:MAG: ATP-dependent Clp protease ATP-binding subunit [Patescibacteria group bacterium]
MADAKKNTSEYIICQRCSGLGLIDRLNCQDCSGIEVGRQFGGLFLYWDKKITRPLIFQEKLQQTVKIIIDSVLFVIGILSLIILLFEVWQMPMIISLDTLLSLKKFVLGEQPSFINLVFWLSILADLFLFYRFNLDLQKMSKIKRNRDKKGDVSNLIDMAWPGFHRLPLKQKLDVSKTYSHAAIKTVEEAYVLAASFGHNKVEPIHLLATLFSTEKIKIMVARLGLNPQAVKTKIESALSSQATGQELVFSVELKTALIDAYINAYQKNRDQVGVIDLLVAICASDGVVYDIFYDLGIDFEKISNVAMWLQFADILKNRMKKLRTLASYKPSGDLDRAMTAFRTPFLDHYGQNLTTYAKYGYLSPCWGRDQEMETIMSSMESGARRNVILVGEDGVGKTNIIEGLAQLMAAEDVPEILKDKRLVGLNVTTLVGGLTPDKAQARLLQIVDEVTAAGNIVLAVENIHQLTGVTVGEAQGVDLSSIIAQAIKKNYFYCIATTTPSDYARYLENSELGDAFQKIEVPEVDRDSAIQILEAKAGAMEYKNQVYFSYEAIERAVDLSVRYMHERYLPEKAIDIAEKVAVIVRKTKGRNMIISGEDVASFVSELVHVPVTQVTADESQKLMNLEKRMHERMVGQDEAVKMVAASLRRARADMRDIKRPIANFLFLGPTGVGKTELAKTVAEVYFGDEKNMLRLDMSEYQEEASIDRLIGSPPGSEEAVSGFLTEGIRTNPFTLILLDEIEKANPKILNIFLQVMDDGRLTDNTGRIIDFTNSIIIATSNAGTEFIQDQIRKKVALENIRQELISNQLKTYFRPEFLNRFDGVIVFRPLSMSEVVSIARLMLRKVSTMLEDKGMSLEFTEGALNELSVAGFDQVLGARPLRRVIQERVEDSLANYLLQNRLKRRDVVVYDVGGQISVKRPNRI